MTEFLFVRHCESQMNLTPHYVGGRSNLTPASMLGERQARQFGHYMQEINLRPDAVFSSGAVRATTTAKLALGTAGLSHPIEIDESLQELAQGIYEGKLRQEVYTPEIIETYRLNDLDGKFPGGESIRDVQDRMWGFIEQQHPRHPDGTILVFSHGLAIRALAGLITKQTKQEILAATTDNVSLTSVTVTDCGTHVNYVGKNVISE